MEGEAWYWWALSRTPGLGAKRFYQLVDRFGSAREAWEASPGNWSVCLPPSLRAELERHRRQFPSLEGKERKRLAELGVEVLCSWQEGYPRGLLALSEPPPLLYVQGRLSALESAGVALVGSRKASSHGCTVARQVGRDLAQLGINVISGMARGIDSWAHRGALEGGGETVAVLGSGLDRPYPRENTKLMQDIAANGAVVSEFPLGTDPKPGHFPVRNRIISALSRGVVVVEAGTRSGSLITVDWAISLGQEVFAVPGNVTNLQCQGSNRLLKQGAHLVTEARDIAEILGLMPLPGNREEVQELLTSDEEKILGLFSTGEMDADEVIRRSGLTASRAIAILLMLEVKGKLQRFPGSVFIATPQGDKT